MSFRILAVTTSLVGFVLAIGYLFAGAIVVGRWQLEPTEAVLLLGRRMAALYLGLSVILFLARSAPASTIRTALCAGAAVALSMLALLGVCELALGHAGPGILASVVIEALLAFGFVRLLLSARPLTDAAEVHDTLDSLAKK